MRTMPAAALAAVLAVPLTGTAPARRLVNLADVVEVFHHVGGIDAATAVARQRSGTQCRHVRELGLVSASWQAGPEN